MQNLRLKYRKGDLADAAAVEGFVNDADVVISVLGPSTNTPGKPISHGYEIILFAMRKLNGKRIIITAGAGVGDAKDRPTLFNHFINLLLRLVARHVLEDMTEAVARVRASKLDWTVVRLPMLTDGPATGNVRTGYVGKGMARSIPRADVADFLLGETEHPQWIKASPVISSGKGA